MNKPTKINSKPVNNNFPQKTGNQGRKVTVAESSKPQFKGNNSDNEGCLQIVMPLNERKINTDLLVEAMQFNAAIKDLISILKGGKDGFEDLKSQISSLEDNSIKLETEANAFTFDDAVLVANQPNANWTIYGYYIEPYVKPLVDRVWKKSEDQPWDL